MSTNVAIFTQKRGILFDFIKGTTENEIKLYGNEKNVYQRSGRFSPGCCKPFLG